MTDLSNLLDAMAVKQMPRPKIMPHGFEATVPYKSYAGFQNCQDHYIILTQWIILNIGEYDPQRWAMRLNQRKINVYFNNEDDATTFKLRWV